MSSDSTAVETRGAGARILVAMAGPQVQITFSFTDEDRSSGTVTAFFKALSEQVKNGFVSLQFPDVTDTPDPHVAPDPSRLN